MFDKASFRAAFPEFADNARYPDAMLDFWAGIGERLRLGCTALQVSVLVQTDDDAGLGRFLDRARDGGRVQIGRRRLGR